MNDAKDTVDVVDPTTELPDDLAVAKRSMLRTITSGVAQIVKGVGLTMPLVAALRKLDSGDALAWFGLRRRRSPLVTIGVFGAGVAAGATVALLFAPTSGSELRTMLADRLTSREKAEPDAPDRDETDAPRAAPIVTAAEPISSASRDDRLGVVPANNEPV